MAKYEQVVVILHMGRHIGICVNTYKVICYRVSFNAKVEVQLLTFWFNFVSKDELTLRFYGAGTNT